MTTDQMPRSKALLEEFGTSDRITSIALPADGRLLELAKCIEEAMTSEKRAIVSRACDRFLAAAADFYNIPKPTVRVLASRPLRVYESGWSLELFGDYDPGKNVTRVWMRTPVRKQVTSFGTFMSTLCHEFCHQLDFQLFGFRHSPHTRGFYERAALLYHHARGTPKKQLFWRKLPGNRFRIDWVRMRDGV
jgi:SprT-like family